MEQQNIPKLRFPEFNDEWEPFELNKVATINPKSKQLPDNFFYIDLESVNNGVLTKTNRISKSIAPSRAQRLLKEGDVLYQTVRPYQKNNLYFNCTDGDYVASTGYAQIRSENSSSYLYYYLHTNMFVDKVLLQCTGTSYPSINSNDLSTITINQPSLPEQQKIASFLSAVDKKIEQLQKKKELLEQYKKGMMQKLFSREIRFQDDNGKDFPEWDNIRIGDVFKVTRGQVLASTDTKKWIEHEYIYPVYSSQTKNKGLMGHFHNYLFENSITWTTDGANAGDVNFREGKFYCTNVCGVLINKEGWSNLCISEIFNSQSHKYVSYVGNPKLMNNVVENIILYLPLSTEEQAKISDFLAALNNKIALTDKELDGAKTFKKGLLQQMFV